MKSSLSLIDREVNTAIAHELGEPSVVDSEIRVDSQRRRYVAGLMVVSNAARDAAADAGAADLFRRLSQFRTDSKILNSKLRNTGITPAAVLPFSAWDYLCTRSKLYRFNPNEKQEVRVSMKALDDASDEANQAKIKTPNMACAWLVPPIAIAFGFLFYRLGLEGFFVFVWDFLASLFGGSFMAIMLEGMGNKERSRLKATILHSKLDVAMKNGVICELLWPEYREPVRKNPHAVIRIGLPDPPPEVQQILVKANLANLHLKVAAVREGITLREDPYDVFMKAEKKRLLEEARLRALADPIVYMVEGSAVAIIAQYGDFPIEQELVTEVVNSVYLS